MVIDDDKWYTQRGRRLQGPYSRLTVHRYLLLGRIKSSDRVSKDGEMWEPITQVPELIPEELLDLNTDLGWRSFIHARDLVDERQHPSVKTSEPENCRRDDEDSILRRLKAQWIEALQIDPQKRKKNNMLPVSLFGVTVMLVVVLMLVNASKLPFN